MDNFLEISLANIFNSKQNNVNKNNFSTFIKLLKSNLPINYLIEIDNWCEQNLTEQNRKNSILALKPSFISYWNKKISKKDVKRIEKYFPLLSIKEQKNIVSLLNKHKLSFNINLNSQKSLHPYTQALNDYKKGLPESLELYLLNIDKITYTNFERLEKFIPQRNIDDFYLKRLAYSKINRNIVFHPQPYDFFSDPNDFSFMINNSLVLHKRNTQTYGIKESNDLFSHQLQTNLINQYYLFSLSSSANKDKKFYYYISSFMTIIGNAQNSNIVEDRHFTNLFTNLELFFKSHPFLKKYIKENSLSTLKDIFTHYVNIEPNFITQYEKKFKDEYLDDNFEFFTNGKKTFNYYLLNNNLTTPTIKNSVKKI